MKPTLQQTEILKSYLAKVLKYNETIDEVYDHVMSALDNKPENTTFLDAINDILNDDFGGGRGLVEMEKQHLKAAKRQAFLQIIKHTNAYFKFPNIFFTLLIFVLMFAVTKYVVPKISFIAYIPLITILVITTFILLRRFFKGYYKDVTKRSIQYIVIGLMYSRFNFFIIYLSMLMPRIIKLFNFKIVQQQMFVTCILTLCFLFLLSIFQLEKDEFKLYRII